MRLYIGYKCDAYASPQGWNKYATGFLVGGIGGAVLAYAIVTNVDVFDNFLSLIGARA